MTPKERGEQILNDGLQGPHNNFRNLSSGERVWLVSEIAETIVEAVQNEREVCAQIAERATTTSQKRIAVAIRAQR